MKELLIKQLEFEHWANQQVLLTLRKITMPDERAVLLFSHLLSSGNMWISRVTGQPITTTLFQERTLDESEKLMYENNQGWLRYIETADVKELNRIVDFIFPLDGSKKRMSVADAILHIVHHSSYHRGQIIARIKGSIEPLPLVTYIAYAAENVS
jgi:uncharacterized damage-inducible protein DinB